MTNDNSSHLAMEKLFQLKDSNIKRQADVHNLRIGLQNLRNDIQLYHVSNKLKFQNLKSSVVDANESKETQVTTQDQSSIDSGQMVNN